MSSAKTEPDALRIVRRLAGVVALAAGAIGVVLLLLGSNGNHRYRILFETGGQLVEGNEVLVGGQPFGSVEELTLTDDAEAEVVVSVREPLREGTTAVVRATSLSGIANRYVSVTPGPDNAPELPNGATIEADRTTAPVDLDQLFDTFDGRTRAALRDVIRGQATIYAGNAPQARRTYRFLAPSLSASERLFAELTRDQRALGEFLVEGSQVLGTVAERRDDLSALTANANQALGAIASENDALDRTLGALPPALRQGNTTFINLRAALDDLDPLVETSKTATRDLAPFLRDLRPVTRRAVPVVRDLRLTVARTGAANDLTELLGDAPEVERRAGDAAARAIEAMDDSAHVIEFARPYTPDLLGFLTKLGQVTAYYDGDGHYARVMPAASNRFGYNAITEGLEPILPPQLFDFFTATAGAFDPSGFARCPGGATQPALDLSSPFTDDGALLAGGVGPNPKCDPGAVPFGP